MKKNLNKLRSDIDKIDRDILDLLSKRAAIAKILARLKMMELSISQNVKPAL